MGFRKFLLASVIFLVAGSMLVFLFFSKSPAVNGLPKVVTTTWPVYVLSAPVVEGHANIYNLTSQSPDPHNFSVTPQMVKEIHEADFLIKNGGGLEPWLDNVLKSADNPDLKIIDLSQSLAGFPSSRYLFELSSQPECLAKGAEWRECGPNTCQIEGGEICPQVCGPAVCLTEAVDPHYWLDPVLAARQVQKIGEVLAAEFKDLGYSNRAEAYRQQLLALAQEIQAGLRPFVNRYIVVQHPAFTYFVSRFRLIQLASFEETPGQEPTTRDLEKIAALIKEKRIKNILAEPGQPESYLPNFADEFDLTLLTLDPMEAGSYSPDYYLTVMRENLKNLQTALGAVNK